MLIKRRNILGGMGGLAVTPLFCNSLAAEEANSNGLIVVSILLSGGNDGLNTVVPLPQYGNYYKLRTPAAPPQGLNLAYSESDLSLLAFNADPKVPPLQATDYAFTPSMLAMRDLYTTGNLAVIAGVSLPLAETNALSHTNATMDWLTGQINIGLVTPPGWLGLSLDGVKGGALGATASMGGSSQLVVGSTHQGLVINPPMDYFGVNYGVSDDQKKLEGAYKKIGVLPASSPTGRADQKIMQTALSDIKTVQAIAKHEKASSYPLQSWLDYQLRDIGRLIVGGAGVRGFLAVQGGYDTHYQQALYQPTLLSQLGQSIVNFYEYLAAASASRNVVIMTMSDFGRRPAANLDFGTDHGGGTVSFVFGDQVKGGVYGTYPSLKQFDPNGNLKMSVDFRNVLSDLIVAMGGDATAILGQTYPALGFI
ncbi:MAG: DUF1501 domain-containing protein [Rhodospirillales bacterium]